MVNCTYVKTINTAVIEIHHQQKWVLRRVRISILSEPPPVHCPPPTPKRTACATAPGPPLSTAKTHAADTTPPPPPLPDCRPPAREGEQHTRHLPPPARAPTAAVPTAHSRCIIIDARRLRNSHPLPMHADAN